MVMAEFQLFAWKESDFEGSFKALVNSAAAFGGASVALNAGSEPVLLTVSDGTDTVSSDTSPVLTVDITISEVIYPKGSKIEVVQFYELDGSPEAKCFACRIGTGASLGVVSSELFILSTEHLVPDQPYKLTMPAKADEPNPATTSFARGTLIDTPHGPQPIERLETGDEVLTRDGGIQLIDRMSLTRLSGLELLLNPNLRPVCIQAGALVGGLPGKDLTVTQQHRLLLNDWRAGYLFGEDEILVPAKSLLNGRNVTIECPETGIDYFEIALEQQDLISANGLWAETCKPEIAHLQDHASERTVGSEMSDQYFYGVFSDTYENSVPALPHSSASALAA